MSSAFDEVPANFTCSREDWQHAWTALEHVLHDQDWTKHELRLRQNRLSEHLRAQGIGRTLALALLKDLLARDLFRAGDSLVDLWTFVRFDGLETGEVTPNRFLHIRRDRWFAHLATGECRFAPRDQNAPGTMQDVSPKESTAASSPSREGCPRLGSASASETTNLWRQDGEIWTLRFAGQSVQLRHRKGLRYLALLLAGKGQSIAAATLVSWEGRPLGAVYAGEAVLDEQALREYRSRYEELQNDLECARRNHDEGRFEKLEAEMFALQRELKAASGLGKRKRKLGDEGERLRKSVQMAITRTLKSIAEKHQTLATHLRRSLRLGRHLSYQPEPNIDWNF